MSGLLILAAALLGAPSSSAPPAKEVSETRCAWLVEGPNGVSSVDTPKLRLLEAAARPGPLVLAPPPGARSVQCGRTSIVPAEHDDELLSLGLPLAIVDVSGPEPFRVAVLEISTGQFSFRLLDGKLTKEEGDAVSQRLNLFQTRLQASSR